MIKQPPPKKTVSHERNWMLIPVGELEVIPKKLEKRQEKL